MRRLAAIFFGMLVGAVGVWGAYNYHVVRSPKEWVLVPKRQPALADIYADIRAWRPEDWRNHPDLVRSLVAYGRSDLVVGTATRGMLEGFLEQFQPRTGQAVDSRSPR